MAAICSVVAASPARIAAGSPGVSRSMRNTSTATTSSTGMVAATRRARNAHISGQSRTYPRRSALAASVFLRFQ